MNIDEVAALNITSGPFSIICRDETLLEELPNLADQAFDWHDTSASGRSAILNEAVVASAFVADRAPASHGFAEWIQLGIQGRYHALVYTGRLWLSSDDGRNGALATLRHLMFQSESTARDILRNARASRYDETINQAMRSQLIQALLWAHDRPTLWPTLTRETRVNAVRLDRRTASLDGTPTRTYTDEASAQTQQPIAQTPAALRDAAAAVRSMQREAARSTLAELLAAPDNIFIEPEPPPPRQRASQLADDRRLTFRREHSLPTVQTVGPFEIESAEYATEAELNPFGDPYAQNGGESESESDLDDFNGFDSFDEPVRSPPPWTEEQLTELVEIYANAAMPSERGIRPDLLRQAIRARFEGLIRDTPTTDSARQWAVAMLIQHAQAVRTMAAVRDFILNTR